MACFASSKQDSASEPWSAEGLAFGSANGGGGAMGASDFNRALRSKIRARFGTFVCRSEEDDFRLFLNFLKVSPQLPQRIDSWGCFPTELKDSFPSVGMDAGLQLRHGLSYGH